MRLTIYADAGSVGGAEIVARHLVGELDRAIEISVLGVEAEVARGIVRGRSQADWRVVRAARGKLDLPAIAAHVRAVRALRPDVVHVNLHSPWAGQYGIVAGLLAGCRVVAVEHSAFASGSRLQVRLRRALCARLDAHVAVGPTAARRIEALLGLAPGAVEAIPNGVPDAQLTPVRSPLAAPVVGAVGRLTREKGFDLLVRAIAALPGEINCVIVGDGPERAGLERLAAELGIERRLAITGWVENARAYLGGFDVVAMPSRFEALPLIAIEAALAERAVIATGVGGTPDAVEGGVTGVLVEPEDPAALAGAIAELLADPGRCARIGAVARARALERFSLARMARSYEALYRRLCADGG